MINIPFRDLLINCLPKTLSRFLVRQSYTFAFLVHPRDESDFYKQFFRRRKVPRFVINFICRFLWPFVISEITGVRDKDGQDIKGIIVVAPLHTKQMLSNRRLALKRITQAAKLSEKLGVRYLGLGALSSSLTKGGMDLLGKVDLTLTTGHAYTVLTVTNYVFDVINRFSLKLKFSTLAIVGAAGSIGSNTAKLIIERGLRVGGLKEIILIDLKKKMGRVEILKRELSTKDKHLKIICSENKKALKRADIIVTATNAPEVVINSKDLKRGVIIIDDAQPTDIDKEVILTRRDVLVLEGGAVQINGVECHLDLGLQNKEDVFSCLAEVIALSISKYKKKFFSIGRLNFELVGYIEKITNSLGFRLANYQNMYKVYTEEEINYIKRVIQKRE